MSSPGPTDERVRYERLYRDHYAEILSYAARRIDIDTARDVAAETFVAAWRRLDQIPTHAARAWLFTTARRMLSNEYRSSERRERLVAKIQHTRPVDLALVPDLADAIVSREQAIALLAGLSTSDREVLELTEWDGLTSAEGAHVVGCSTATFRVRLHRARRRLLALYKTQQTPHASDVVLAARSQP